MPGHLSELDWLGRRKGAGPPAVPDFAALLDALPMGVFAYCPQRGVLYANQAVAERLGRPAAELIGITPEAVFSPHVAARLRDAEAAELVGPLTIEVPFARPEGGEDLIFLLSASPCEVEGWGRVFAVAAQDVTRECEIEIDLARERDFVQALFDTTDALLIVVDTQGRIVRWNRACERLTGFHISEYAGRPFSGSLLCQPSRGEVADLLARAASDGGVLRARLTLCGRDGASYHVSWSATALGGGEGQTGYTLLTGVDETSIVVAERQQEESALEFQAVWGAVADLMMFLDSSGVIVAANDALCRHASQHRSDVEGRQFIEVFQQWPGHEHDELAQFRERFESRSFPEREIAEYRLASGRDAWLEITSSFVERRGQGPLLLQVARDITDRVRREQQLREANHFLESATQWAKEMAASAELASAAKSEFLANVSHEIRTPMNGILGMTELALMTELTGEQREYLEMVETSAESLLNLLDDILDLSKAEAGRIDLRLAPFDPGGEIEGLMKPIAHRAAAKNLTARFSLSPNLPPALVGDWGRLRQVLLNLLANAVKFTDGGGVQLAVDCLGYEKGKARIRFLVSDSGIGIAASRVHDAFAPFTQLDGSNTRRRGGTGLGLSISSRLVDLMGGRLFACGEEGKGASFCFVLSLPVAADGLLPIPEESTAPASHRLGWPARCLLAEDNPVNQRLFLTMLEHAGLQATLARNGREAVQLVSERQFDVVIMDVQMPELDGIEATAAIRELERGAARRLPIIAITAHAMPGDRDLCIGAGMDGYLSKPIRGEALIAEIRRVLPNPPDSDTMEVDSPSENSRTIMIDYALALDRVGGDRELLSELAGLFLDEYPRLLGESNAGIENGDLPAAAAAAHQLKGLLAQFGSEDGRQLALALESAAKSGDPAAARLAQSTLSSHLDSLRETFVALSRGEALS